MSCLRSDPAQGRTESTTLEKPPPSAFSPLRGPKGRWRHLGSQARNPQGGEGPPPGELNPHPGPTPNPQSGFGLSEVPAASPAPGHRSRSCERTRPAAPAAATARKTVGPKAGSEGPGEWVGNPEYLRRRLARRPERDRLRSARGVRLAAGGARRCWRPQDQRSDSGSGQMSCCLSTARAAAQHSPL